MRFEKALEGMREEYDYKKKLRLFELDMLKKGHKFMNIPDAIAPELRDECYSFDKDNFFKQNDLADGLSAGRFYYVRKKKGKIVIRQAHLFSTLKTEKAIPFVDFDDNDIEEVLAPVPSYDELQDMKEYLDYSINNRNQLTIQISRWIDKINEEKEENARLKELLKECKDIIEWYKANCEYKDLPTESILTKIEEALR